MDIQEYLSTMRKIQENLLEFLESSDDFSNVFGQFTIFLSERHFQIETLNEFLNLISKISMNHHRTINFIKKIESILTFLKSDILSKVSNLSLFNTFCDNKRILLFLFKNNFLTIDDYIYNQLTSSDDFTEFFTPELILYQMKKPIEDAIFEENREKGENNSYLCELIRNDSVKEFIILLNKNKFNLTTKIKSTCFETNPFLLEKTSVSLIEYAAFFGSIQIFRYLYSNNVELNSSLWLFAIHSNNPEIIHFLEENHVLPDDKSYQYCLKESIKCYHNDIAHYIQDNLLEKSSQTEALFEFYNFEFLFGDFKKKQSFNQLCRYNYLLLAKIIIENVNINEAMNDVYLIIILYNTIV